MESNMSTYRASEDSLVVGMTMPSQPPAGTEEPLDLLAMDMKNLMKKIRGLSHLGIEDSKITLPKICVVGDQSTGKSSLIEGISEIKVPRNAGTCTRCPMEINLSESKPDEPWKCVVHLSRRYFFNPDKKATKIPSRSEPLGPWMLHGNQEDEHFITLMDKNDVKDAISWAQLAILNPSTNSQDYVPGKNAGTPQTTQVKFSPNLVRLDISAPNFPNLSFYDLPGVISQAEHDDERYLVRLVENLVKDFVSQKQCIVLLTLTMTDDATNSSAARIMRDIKGAKERTLGVLTKPDRLAVGESFDQWFEILSGQKFNLGHGYYVVRNNPNPEVDHFQARLEEDQFFGSDIWIRYLPDYQSRFGTKKLQAALSTLLLQQIQGCLPSIIAQIDDRASCVDSALKTLPDPPNEDVQRILFEQRSLFGERIRGLVDGGSGMDTFCNPLQKSWNHLVSDFQKALAITRPTVVVSATSDKDYLAEKVDSDCDMVMLGSSPCRKRKAPVDSDSADIKPPPTVAKKLGYSTPIFENWDRPGRRFTLEEIRGIKEDSYRAGIPNQIDPRAIEALNGMSVKHWDDLMKTFLEASHKAVRNMIFQTLDEVFTSYRQTGLYRELCRIVNVYMTRLHAEHLRHGKDIYTIEHSKPFTMAQEQHKKAMREASANLLRARQVARAGCYLELRGIGPDDETRASKIKKITPAELGPDQYLQELEMMASSRGYYEIASSRFLDVICQSVHTNLFSKCRDDLIRAIDDELQIFGPNALDRCLELMAEDPDRQRRRAELLREREKLTKAQEWLDPLCRDEDEETLDHEDSTQVPIKSVGEWDSIFA
ncbi:interferon-induced GTP-binding protein Mx [Penicillium alfredii]|uniref:Interferon-induced GTP-binding protein Mx n=1 Tax=Penicillium alfredii TaxID=1506179 RepID=A0A9W9FTA0_9EURO|nr:interferon-induced GTP-binding protein Mx [Penicillium alfredii]KAJ5105650.1 interferon-induced GTP-binding protein Mx [Penicillium alfredii]